MSVVSHLGLWCRIALTGVRVTVGGVRVSSLVLSASFRCDTTIEVCAHQFRQVQSVFCDEGVTPQ